MSSKSHVSVLLLVLIASVSASTDIKGPQVTPWGDYGDWGMCPKGSFVYGVRLSVQPKQGGIGGDDTGLNDIELFCRQEPSSGFGGSGGSFGQQGTRFETTVQVPRAHGQYGGWGKWQEKFACPENRGSYAIGLQLKIEGQQGVADDTAANDVRLICSGGAVVTGVGGAPWGSWKEANACPSGTKICGMRTKIEKSRGSGIAFGNDDTAVNTIDIRCC